MHILAFVSLTQHLFVICILVCRLQIRPMFSNIHTMLGKVSCSSALCKLKFSWKLQYQSGLFSCDDDKIISRLWLPLSFCLNKCHEHHKRNQTFQIKHSHLLRGRRVKGCIMLLQRSLLMFLPDFNLWPTWFQFPKLILTISENNPLIFLDSRGERKHCLHYLRTKSLFFFLLLFFK